MRDNRLERGGTVAHFHDALASSVAIKHFGGAFFQNFFRKAGRPCAEIENSRHIHLFVYVKKITKISELFYSIGFCKFIQ